MAWTLVASRLVPAPRGDLLDGTRLQVLLALVRVHAREGRATVRMIGQEAGIPSTGHVLHVLRRLRDLGFCAWEDGTQGTIRPTLQPVRFG